MHCRHIGENSNKCIDVDDGDKRIGLGQPPFINCRVRPFSPVIPKLYHSSLPKIVIIGTTSARVEVRSVVY